MFFYTWPIKKIKNEKEMSNQRHVSEFAELDGEGGILEKKNYEDANQTENNIYYRGEKHY